MPPRVTALTTWQRRELHASNAPLAALFSVGLLAAAGDHDGEGNGSGSGTTTYAAGTTTGGNSRTGTLTGGVTTANRRLQLPDPDEQPGAMPEIAPSPGFGRNIERRFTERSMVLQSWGAYGTAWPVVHQQLGVRPNLGRGRLEVVPASPGAPHMLVVTTR